MKNLLGKRLIIIIGAGLFCVGLISIWVAYLSEVSEQKDLSENDPTSSRKQHRFRTRRFMHEDDLFRNLCKTTTLTN